jgi:hypothetical protein
MKTTIGRQLFLGAAFASACAVASLVYAQVRPAGDVASALNSEGLTQQRAQELLSASVPVGGVIPYFGSAPLPPNWRICDGSVVTDTASPFNGRHLPDLRARFLLGATDSTQIGLVGGSTTSVVAGSATTINGSHSHEMSHSHSLPSTTGFASDSSQSSGNLFQAMWGDARQNEWGRAHFVTERTQNGWDAEGQHRHDLGGITDGASRSSTETKGEHSHQVNGFSITNFPPYVQTLYAMRVR